jgi:hypothetical protein
MGPILLLNSGVITSCVLLWMKARTCSQSESMVTKRGSLLIEQSWCWCNLNYEMQPYIFNYNFSLLVFILESSLHGDVRVPHEAMT